ncbi:MAG: porphobilinogen synthase [Candidatus Omnitrophota bacterium]
MQEIIINIKDLIYPVFVKEGKAVREKIPSMPGIYRLPPDTIVREIEELVRQGVGGVLLFGIPEKKDKFGSRAYKKDSVVARAIIKLKESFPKLIVMTDVCLCAYISHGHCGIIKPSYISCQSSAKIDNIATLKVLAQMALSHAEAGADYVAPSAMAKGQVSAIRKTLDAHGFKGTKIMGYSAKYASNFYGPFRDACDSSPAFGDRSSYQLSYSKSSSAIKEIAADIKEGADIVMVKPALSYLDIIKEASSRFRTPLAAYNVSGEYAMVKHSAKLGILDEKKIVFEIMASIKRAGADLIITYHAKDIARWLKKN